MPIIQVNLLEGRSAEQKRALHAALAEAAAAALGVPAGTVRVLIHELGVEHFALAGITAGEWPLAQRRPASANAEATANPPHPADPPPEADGPCDKERDMTVASSSLPPGFEALDIFVPYWCLDSNDQRRAARSTAAMADIQRFYDAIVAQAEAAIVHCEQYPLGQMPPATERLFKLLLAMNHAAIAVEMHGEPRAADSTWPSAVRITQGPWPHGERIGVGVPS
jgi:4-oxalocrotonate tautomerase family enzyme